MAAPAVARTGVNIGAAATVDAIAIARLHRLAFVEFGWLFALDLELRLAIVQKSHISSPRYADAS
jgi:hypothetical protein